MNVIWKDIPDCNGLYRINNLGEVLSLKSGKPQPIKLVKVAGYWGFGFYHDGNKRLVKVHRIVATLFVPNPHNKPFVHHIDHNRLNARWDNLMWVTASENSKFDYSTGGRIGKTNMKGLFGELNPASKAVRMISKDGEIKVINGISEAARIVNGSASHIVKVCNGKLKHHKGYKWEYA